MKLFKTLASLVIGVCAFSAAEAAPMLPNGMWQCFATNDRGMIWYQNAVDRAQAMQGARARCFAHGSRFCHAGGCRFKSGGGGRWSCRVRDRSGRVWTGFSGTASDACFNAKNQCRAWHNARGIRNYICEIVAQSRT